MAQLFARHAQSRPEAPAVVHGDVVVTYHDLDHQSLQLAQVLRDHGVGPGSVVAVHLARSVDMIVSWLATVRAGGAYAPLDPAYPAIRLQQVLTDLDPTVIITADPSSWKLNTGIALVAADEATETAGPMPVAWSPHDLCYVMYTSGSTAEPKGVEIEQRAVLGLLIDVGYVQLGPEERILQASATSFDAATFEVWGALLHGGCCVLLEGALPEPSVLSAMVAKRGVTTMFLTTAQFNLVIDEVPHALRGVRQVLFGGEAVSVAHVERARRMLRDTRLIHVYGPTEVTTFSTSYEVPTNPRLLTDVPIGRPIEQTTAMVLTEDGTPARTGAWGELYLGGDRLARGYRGRPAETARYFLQGIAGTDGRWYRTGDLVRVLEGGELSFLRRTDSQVKIRGFRVELTEVEQAMMAHPGVLRAAATADRVRGVDHRRLIGYYVPTSTEEFASDDLARFLRDRMPAHLIPSLLIACDDIPLGPTGKTDRARLAELIPPTSAPATGTQDHTPEQQVVSEVWAELLGGHAGLDTNFFDAGGDSLALQRLRLRLAEVTGAHIDMVALFEHTTVRTQAAFVHELTGRYPPLLTGRQE